jgi:hypothetical protein
VRSLSIVERERVALHALHAIGERFCGEQPAISVDELSLALSMPPDLLEQMLDALIREGLVAPTDEDPPRFLPARPWESATLAEALSKRSAGRGVGASPIRLNRRVGCRFRPRWPRWSG